MIKKFQMVTIGFFFVACNSDDAVVVVSNLRWFAFNSWVANFSKYVALGNH
jgi:hypothetical protein